MINEDWQYDGNDAFDYLNGVIGPSAICPKCKSDAVDCGYRFFECEDCGFKEED